MQAGYYLHWIDILPLVHEIIGCPAVWGGTLVHGPSCQTIYAPVVLLQVYKYPWVSTRVLEPSAELISHPNLPYLP